MPTVARSVPELLGLLDGIAHVAGDRLVVVDEAALRGRGIRDVVWSATFSEDPATVEAARWIVWEASQEVGARSASIHELYVARSRGEYGGLTVPAINLRAQTFDMARVIFETARANDASAVILELARSEQTYTFQRVSEYATSVLAGAVAAGWHGPVFIQGDHYQFNAKKYAADPEAITEEIRKACRDAIAAGYRNIDIDSSTLVDLSRATLDEQQQENYRRAAELTALIRGLETDGVTVSVGGEIGEVGKKNSTPDELRAYLDGYRRELDGRAPGAVGLAKVSVQTGTSHGGVPLPGGGVAEVKLDFAVLEKLGEVAREYGLAGAVQHGASTLPDELFHRFPAVGTAEIHLATGFQNALYEHPAFPPELHHEIEAWCYANAADERKPDQTDTQFVYTTRKKAIGPFKRTLWDLPDQGRDPRLAGGQDRVPVPAARRPWLALHRRAVREAGRGPPAAARGAQGGRGGAVNGAASLPQRSRDAAAGDGRRVLAAAAPVSLRATTRHAAGTRLTILVVALVLASLGLIGTAGAGGNAALAASGDKVLVGAGDVARCGQGGDEATAALIDKIPGLVFVAGDTAYPNGSARDFADCYDSSWGRFKTRTRPAVGNHEYVTSGAAAYFDYFGWRAGNPKRGYYSYTLGAWHVVVLNSNCWAVGGCGKGSAQERWLRRDLAAHPTACTLGVLAPSAVQLGPPWRHHGRHGPLAGSLRGRRRGRHQRPRPRLRAFRAPDAFGQAGPCRWNPRVRRRDRRRGALWDLPSRCQQRAARGLDLRGPEAHPEHGFLPLGLPPGPRIYLHRFRDREMSPMTAPGPDRSSGPQDTGVRSGLERQSSAWSRGRARRLAAACSRAGRCCRRDRPAALPA